MGEPSLRAAALAGLVSAGLLIAGPGVAPAFAQPSDSGTSSQGSDSAGDGSGEEPSSWSRLREEPSSDPSLNRSTADGFTCTGWDQSQVCC